jgi:hypothetical protein
MKKNKDVTVNKEDLFKDVTLAQVYEALCCIAIKLDTMMSIFEKIDKEIDKRHGV